MPSSNVRIIVNGLVQGVGFRYYVYRQARSLGLTGYARNLPSGQVEVVACGEKGLIDELIKAVRNGPRFASVAEVYLEEINPVEKYKDFNIR